MNLFLKSIIASLYSAATQKNNAKNGLRVLMYHSVTKEDSLDDIWSIGSTSFTDHLAYFCDNKDIKTLTEGLNNFYDTHLFCRASKNIRSFKIINNNILKNYFNIVKRPQLKFI